MNTKILKHKISIKT